MDRFFLIVIVLCVHFAASAESMVGVACTDITPPTGVPSAGYEARKGAPMQGVRDRLLASTIVIDNLVFCSVDHLGMPYSLIERVKAKAKEVLPQLEHASFFIGSSHTHSGGGAYCDIPVIGEMLAGPYDEAIAYGYVQGIVQSIVEAAAHKVPALIYIGYTKVEGLTQYRSKWPETKASLQNDLAVFKITKLDGSPLAAIFSFAMHPTVLKADNMNFSADFIGHSRKAIADMLGSGIACVYFNGAQAEIVPQDHLDVETAGTVLGNAVVELWHKIEADTRFTAQVKSFSYAFIPKATPFGFTVPLERYETALSLLIVNDTHLFVTVPGELSALYNNELVREASLRGYNHLTIFGLVNDAHGYILMPEAWRAKTQESALSFGGEFYGTEVTGHIRNLIPPQAPGS